MSYELLKPESLFALLVDRAPRIAASIPEERCAFFTKITITENLVYVPTPAGPSVLVDSSPQKLRDYFLELVKSNFGIYQIYQRLNEEKIKGWIKKVDVRITDAADVGVTVEGVEQDKLVELYEKNDFSTPVEITVHPMTPIGDFLPYSPDRSYKVLNLAGYTLKIESHRRKSGSVIPGGGEEVIVHGKIGAKQK